VVTHTDLQAIYNTFQQATTKQIITITDEMKSNLEAEMVRTGKGSCAIILGLKAMGLLPEGLNMGLA